jgi:hypothetical protein
MKSAVGLSALLVFAPASAQVAVNRDGEPIE